MSGAVLLTGATGFLGMETLARLIDRGEEQIITIVRAEDDEGARARLSGVLAQLYDAPPPGAERVHAVRGDLLQPCLGLAPRDRERIVGSVDRIIHCAASISFDLPLAESREINVGGVARIIELARQIAATGRLRRLLHVSTAYVGGCHEGPFGEEDLDVGQEFRNPYQRSKHEAETLLQDAADLPVVIARPSIVVGHRVSGWTPVFNVIYWPIRAVERGLLEEVPARAEAVVDFVPVDYVAAALVALLEQDGPGATCHLVAGARAMNAGELVETYSRLAAPGPAAPRALRLVEPGEDRQLPPGAEALRPYFDVHCRFGDTRAGETLLAHGIAQPDPRELLPKLIAYARLTAWGRRPISRQASLEAIEHSSRSRLGSAYRG